MSLFGNKESVKEKNSLVIYFSRADENYAVGNIDKGNILGNNANEYVYTT